MADSSVKSSSKAALCRARTKLCKQFATKSDRQWHDILVYGFEDLGLMLFCVMKNRVDREDQDVGGVR